ncbi:MAG: helix-turn-helix domain-containing protein [Actinomycetota bacterium]|nr:helix-turn-helix domain-containing protein [Actinomycetota bacterium]
MPGPFGNDLCGGDRHELELLVRHQTAEQRVTWAWIVLEAADCVDNARIAEHLGVALNTMIKWRKRFFEGRNEGLEGAEAVDISSGSTPTFSPSGES